MVYKTCLCFVIKVLSEETPYYLEITNILAVFMFTHKFIGYNLK